jgi:F-type H+-transporting ATPase subunit b
MVSGLPIWFGAEAAGTDILSTLGIDWKLLIFQIIAFLLLVVILGKWIFPVFFRIIDKRQAAAEESNRAAKEASEHAEKAQAEIKKLLAAARDDAKDIVSTAKEEAASMVSDAEQKGKVQAERIVAAAHQEIAKEVVAAKKALHNETVDLIAQATEKVVGKSVAEGIDHDIITNALEESKS